MWHMWEECKWGLGGGGLKKGSAHFEDPGINRKIISEKQDG
jgi:hypothetical protein